MYVATIPNRGSTPAILLRESYREAGKTKNRTLANLSDWPSERIELFRAVLRGDKLAPLGSDGFEIRRSLPHGHVLAALTVGRRIGLDDLLPRRAPQRRRDLALALIVARLLEPAAKLATARMLDRPQLVIGLLCVADGCPVAVEVFEGNTADPATVAAQVAKLKQRFRLRHVVLVGDRGMLTAARIEQTLRPAGLDWITALRGPAIRQLAEAGALQFSLFDTRDMAEITSPDYPDERLVVCKNPLLAEERRRKRDELLALTEADLSKIQTRVGREKNPLRGAGAIGKAVGAVIGKRKMAKHFELTITDEAFSFTRKTEAIAEEARFDGFYVLRTSVPVQQADTAATVRAYKSLAQVERAFRCIKTVDLELRPVFHWTAPRVRAHVLLCMLAYYLEWHMRKPLAPMLFDDHDRASAEASRASPVAKAQASKAAYRKASTQRIDAGDGQVQPVHGFRTLLDDLATLTRNTVCFGGGKVLTVYPTATPVQRRAFGLLGVELAAA